MHPSRVPAAAWHRAHLLCAALHCARAAQRAWRLAAQRARSLYCLVRPCAVRNSAAWGTHRAAQGTRARGAARSLTLMTQPAPGAGSPTDDNTEPARHASLLLLCCHRRLQNAHRSPRSGFNRLVMPRPPAPGSQRGSPRPACASGSLSSCPPSPPLQAPPPPLLPSPPSTTSLLPLSSTQQAAYSDLKKSVYLQLYYRGHC